MSEKLIKLAMSILGKRGRGKAKARKPDQCRKAQRASVAARLRNKAKVEK